MSRQMVQPGPQVQKRYKYIKVFKPLEWQIAPWNDTSPVMLLTGSAGGGKCQKGDTLVSMADGSRKQIVDVAVGVIVLSYVDDRCHMPGLVTATESCGEKEVVRVTTRSGYSIEVSAEHPVYTNHGWVKSSKLRLDDYIATARTLPFGDEKGDDSYIKIVAYLIGDGSVGDTVARFHNTNSVLVEDVREAVESLGHTLRKSGKIAYTIVGGDCKRGQNEIINRLRDDGLFGKVSNNKFVPEWVFSLPKEQVALFLSRLFATDGWASIDSKSNRPSPTIGYGTISKQLAYDVADLLRKFGIVPRVSHRPMFIGDKQYDDLYTVEFSSRDFVIRFAKEIGIYGKEGAVQSCEELAFELDPYRGSDVVPQNIVIEAMSQYKYVRDAPDGLSPHELRNKRKNASSRANAHRYGEVLHIPELVDLATDDVYWDRVKSVEYTGEIAEMYDIEVATSHNYVGNNFTLHNSRLAAEKMHGFMLRYPGSTGLILRKERSSMSNSTLVFLQRVIIGSDPRVTHKPGSFRFEYDNGSILAYGGMKDDSQREAIRSIGIEGGLDIVWMEEATRFTEEDFNEVMARMRGKAAPWTQIILTTNPDAPGHWIRVRLILNNEASLYKSSALDNTYNPKEYVEAKLKQLTGVQYKRLVLGEWAAGAGRIIDTWVDEYNPETGEDHGGNITEAAEYIPNAGTVIWTIDDGYSGKMGANGIFTVSSHPRAFLLCQIRPDGIISVFAESVAIEKLATDHIREVMKMCQDNNWRIPHYVIRDRAAASLDGALSNFNFRARYNQMTVEESIKELREWVAPDANGVRKVIVHPRCFYVRYQMQSYSYDNDGKVIKGHDDTVDSLRYLVWDQAYGFNPNVDIVTIRDIMEARVGN